MGHTFLLGWKIQIWSLLLKLSSFLWQLSSIYPLPQNHWMETHIDTPEHTPILIQMQGEHATLQAENTSNQVSPTLYTKPMSSPLEREPYLLSEVTRIFQVNITSPRQGPLWDDGEYFPNASWFYVCQEKDLYSTCIARFESQTQISMPSWQYFY